MDTIISLVDPPFTIDGYKQYYSVFNRYNPNIYSTATLYVPIGTKSKYCTNSGWKDFRNIVEGMPTGIASVEQEDIKDREIKETYDINGRKTTGLQRGINFIKMSDGTKRKIVVK